MNAKSILDNIKGIKNVDKNEYLLDKTKGTLTSALIGGGMGFFIAYKYKHNLLLGTIIGAGIAGVAANIIVSRQ